MTDKEIIIESIDIRKCKHFGALYESCPNGFGGITIENYCYLYEDNCEKYPQCLYRSNQLQQLDQLKAENEQWQKELDKTHLLMLQKQDELIKAEQTLAEIKEIAEQISLPMGTGKSSNRVILANQILQKINGREQ